MVADTKKTQTLINKVAAHAVTIEQIAGDLEDLRGLFTAQNVDPTGTPLQGKISAVSAWINAVRAVADDPVVVGLLAAVVPSHRGEAL